MGHRGKRISRMIPREGGLIERLETRGWDVGECPAGQQCFPSFLRGSNLGQKGTYEQLAKEWRDVDGDSTPRRKRLPRHGRFVSKA